MYLSFPVFPPLSVFLSVCQSVCLSLCLSVCLSFPLFIYLCLPLFVFLSVCLSFPLSLSVFLSFPLFFIVHLSLSVHRLFPSVHLSFLLSFSLTIFHCLFRCQSVVFSLCLFALFVFRSACLSVNPSFPLFICLSIRLSSPPLCLAVCLSLSSSFTLCLFILVSEYHCVSVIL
ncbi:unnamed protein product [Acanthosepion pharaonis]|uniref:Uncharacterized protein n=1 Tax=Acanthosepion pharaonis TaxID=158019 RepID=A0A812AVN3_ACAPH|nr:unnamed protein product [Sepia pharaonis]